MSKEKQIEELTNELVFTSNYGTYNAVANYLVNKGYRKQSEGEWIGKTDYAGHGYYCSNCNAVFTGENAEWIAKEHYYCGKCGAKMKGGDTE